MNLSTKPTKAYPKNYYSKFLREYKTNSQRTWQVMKEVTGKQKTNLNLQENKVDKSIIQNSQDIAKEFNKFFTSVGPT